MYVIAASSSEQLGQLLGLHSPARTRLLHHMVRFNWGVRGQVECASIRNFVPRGGQGRRKHSPVTMESPCQLERAPTGCVSENDLGRNIYFQQLYLCVFVCTCSACMYTFTPCLIKYRPEFLLEFQGFCKQVVERVCVSVNGVLGGCSFGQS